MNDDFTHSMSPLLTLLLVINGLLLLDQSIAGETPDPQNIAINEVYYSGSLGEDWVELVNRGSEDIDINGWRWCSRFEFPTITINDIIGDNEDLIIEPGEIIVLEMDIDLNDDAADLGLYLSLPFDSESNMVDFVQWGTAGEVGCGPVAEMKGIWLELNNGVYDFEPTATGGQTLNWCGTESDTGFLTTSLDLINHDPSQGVANVLECNLIFSHGFE